MHTSTNLSFNEALPLGKLFLEHPQPNGFGIGEDLRACDLEPIKLFCQMVRSQRRCSCDFLQACLDQLPSSDSLANGRILLMENI